MGKPRKQQQQESKLVVVEASETATIPTRDFTNTDTEIVQMAKQDGSLANTLAKYAEAWSRTVSVFRVILYWLYLEVEYEITNNVPMHLRMTNKDAAEYIKDTLGCDHNPYHRRGVKVDVPDRSEGRDAISKRSKHVANLCSYFSGKSKEGIPLSLSVECGTISELQKLSSAETKADKREKMSDAELLDDVTIDFLKKEAGKLITESGKFASAVEKLLKEHGIKVPVMEVKVTRRVVKK